MSDEEPLDDPAIREAMEKTEEAFKLAIEHFDQMTAIDDYKPMTAEERADYKARFKAMSREERDAYALRTKLDGTHWYANIFRQAATSAPEKGPWQLESAMFHIVLARDLTLLRYEIELLTKKVSSQKAFIDWLKARLAVMTSSNPKGGWWPPKWLKGRQWRNN